jgi:hypothetical protein
MSFTFAQSGSIALNQFESSSGMPIVMRGLFFRRFRETRIQLLSTLRFTVPIQARYYDFRSVYLMRFGNTVSLFTT